MSLVFRVLFVIVQHCADLVRTVVLLGRQADRDELQSDFGLRRALPCSHRHTCLPVSASYFVYVSHPISVNHHRRRVRLFDGW